MSVVKIILYLTGHLHFGKDVYLDIRLKRVLYNLVLHIMCWFLCEWLELIDIDK